ncbi:MAG: hybrid sensor histidine kinase/response regulator [Thermodesulfobacteriota bacterium]|nr:hybrid sensor histidine kinase/response regulator [Thermodesulfobacteriota bacterium]
MGDDEKTFDDLITNDPDMINTFVSEAKEHLDTIEDDFLNLEKQKDNPDQALVDKVFRSIHSVKGAAGFLGIANMTKLAHVMETLLSRMRAGKIRAESRYIDALLAGVDFLSAMLDDTKNSHNIDITNIHDRLSSLVDHEISSEASESVRPIEEETAKPAAGRVEEMSVVETSGVDFGRTIRVNLDLLDKLMVLAGELVLVRNRHLLSVGASDPGLHFISQQLDVVTSEMQETIIRTRMQPVGKVFRKLPRLVRELGKKLGKQIKIDINGSEAELDRTILESLADPMTHIIRNSCGHGIETPDERIRAGKPKSGKITVSAYHEAGRVNIEIRDDGRGIDPELIRKRLLEKGLKTDADLDLMNDEEILRFILLPGFSTLDKTDDVSGRGVGMDVVKTGIEKLGGSFDLASTVGESTTIHLRLPLTLAIIPCLIVASGINVYAIPQVSLVELVCLYDKDVKERIECADDQEVYQLRDHLLPMVRLSEVLARPKRFTREVRAGISEKYRKEQEKAWLEYVDVVGGEDGGRFTQSLNFAVLKAGASRFGLIVDKILGAEEIVVKPMHWAVKSLGIYSGATIMGNGNGALILDVEGIAKHAGIALEGGTDRAAEQTGKIVRDEDLQTVLLFKSGEKEQFAIALPLIGRIQAISSPNIEQVGQEEYITVDDKSTRVLRLDHVLNVSAAVEREEMYLILPRHIKRPVGILASSLVDTEETTIELNVDSYMEDGLLGTSIIRDSMTLFIDIYRLIDKIEPEWFSDRRMRQFGGDGSQPESAKQVLLLEDALFFRHLVKGYLEADGYKVITAENGRIGLDRMEEMQFDLIVSDLDMPVMDGWDFLKRVRKDSGQPDIPAVALTSLDSETDRRRAMDCGFDRYEIKLDRERFLTTVAELLNSRKDGP